MEVPRFAAVVLSLMLAVNCFMPCYTLAYAVESQGVENVPQEDQEEIFSDAGGFELAFGGGESNVDASYGGAAAEGHGSDDGAAERAIEDTSADYGGLVLTSDLPLYSARAASAADVVGQTWGSVKDTVSATWGLVKDYLTWFYDGSTSWQTNISTADKVKIIPQFTTLNLLKQQWGYNYGTGNTIVWAKNSPAGWLYSINDLSERIRVNTNLTQDYLSSVKNYLKATAGDGVEYSAASYLRNTRQDVGSIKSYLVANGGDGVPYPAASWLKSAVDELRSIDTYSGYIRINTNFSQEKLSTVSSLTERVGNFLKAKADDGVEYSAASYLHTLAKNSSTLLGYSKSTGSDGVEYSFTGFLNMIAERTRSSAISLSTLLDYEKANGFFVSSGFSDVLEKLGNLSISVDVDLSGVESRLDDIKFMLGVAGVVENAKDVLDAIFGDMGFDATEAASAAVGNAIQNAFPFCVPAVLKQMLGFLQADPAPPEFHFDFWGAPLDFGFSDWQGLADMTSWLSRIGFAVVLFANSRRFVYSGGVAGD